MYWNSDNVRHVTNPHEGRRIVRASEQLTVGIDSQSPHIGEEIDGPTAEIPHPDADDSTFSTIFEAAAGTPEEVEGNYGMMFTRWPDSDGSNGGYIMCHDCGTEKYFFGDTFDTWVETHSTPGPGGCPTLAQSQYDLVAKMGDYDDFEDCQNKNRSKVDDVDAYCGEIKHRTEDKESSRQTTAAEDEDPRRRHDLSKNWGAGQLTPQQIRDEMALGQGVDFGAFESRQRTATVKTAMNWWDAIEDPRHVVAGWNWDDHLSGYVAEGMFDFECSCGAHVAAPGHTACTCGRLWNSYTIATNQGTRLVAREVPVREGVILADRRHTADGQRYVRDEEYWGLPEGTPIKPGQKPQGDSGGSKPDPEPVRDPEPTPEPEPAPEPAPAPEPEKPKLPPLTEEQIQQHIEEVQAKVDKALEDGFETQLYYMGDGGKGTYTAERRRQQRHLISRFWSERGADHIPREGKAIMSGGLGGAGKTTILKSEGVGIDQSQYLTINADDIKEMMVDEGMIPEIEGCAPMELAALIHEESSDISQAIALEAYRDGVNVIWDLTMGSTGSIEKRLNFMREAGYDQIDAVFVDIPVEKSVERAVGRYKSGLERYRNGKGDGGRYVPPHIIRKNKPSEGSQFNSKNREVFESLKDQFDNAVVYDNSGGPGEHKKVNGFGRWAARLGSNNTTRYTNGARPFDYRTRRQQ